MAKAQAGTSTGTGAGSAHAAPAPPPLARAEPAVSYKYRHTASLQEDHREPLFCIAFNTFDLRHRDVFASVGQHRATIYRLLPAGQFEVLQVYEDGDRGRKTGGGGGSSAGGGGGFSDAEEGAAAAAGAAGSGGGGGRHGSSASAAATTPNGEHFYCCKWSADPDTGAALLLLAGEKALVRVLDVSRGCLVATFAGHGKSINDIAVHPDRPHLFLTASEDESVRLWNLRSRTCVAIFAGEGGHRNKVLSLDFHPWDGHRFLSSGMDNAVKVWSLAPLERLLEESERAADGCVGGPGGGGPRRAFPTRVVQQPLFSTLRVHNDYVDCVRWLGDLVLSKSVHDIITLWRPHSQAKHRRPPPVPEGGGAGGSGAGGSGGAESEDDEDVGVSASGRLGGEAVAGRATKIADFRLDESLRTWFVRFAMDLRHSVLACGSAKGKVFVFCPLVSGASSSSAPLQPRARLTAKGCNTVVRQTAVSWDGGTILAACEDGSIQRWDRDSGEAGGEEQ
ncbi:hypothetical protein HYH03_016873 [Edaphochlamys debaryana]|uniref:Uncharacterized protein n=1 Tax=Edaphochlamys debaryana TaxID=47281 RepID=A0A836BPG9_9CHLO|nr:hypothetical protein HYH03_016873 [Edaphochlamys debaryana]|eukprot:KAG2484331.1 hypothetical protein HYH03_016873 [Edaphochlamys debaryana]